MGAQARRPPCRHTIPGSRAGREGVAVSARALPYAAAAARTLAGTPLAALAAVALGSGMGAARATLRGRVVDSEFGNPLAGAVVRVKGGPPPLTTDSLGWVETKDLPGGDAEVAIPVLGYTTSLIPVDLP